ncbi:hypothetical protein ABB37_09206 [Leptomonas pyrrhocoris]|uniref:Uncharacterized protein n=1 Tax=Leptomonas pyrrhocoris TaxID=157538 RepID=A0A0N0DRE1_LEPPY|nr:hypothetical protein ABB37_09206 [Leptomonas pyrrhocoris]KPA74568.1 hypothetical protein ABB37_09206 [Leptomonas pyrrhocoris]|eukprot:XP_015653007.1 hypothetical protein ABB37_09206 [Leptomonas pyrrhocoris]
MRSKRRASLRHSAGMHKSMSPPRSETRPKPEDGPHTYAEYLERRSGLVSAIQDELDEHTLLMEERARQAVAHAAAVIQSSRNQEKECLAYLNRLEDKIQALQQTRRTAAAELTEFQQSAAGTRQQLEKELHELRQKVQQERTAYSTAQTALQEHQHSRRAEEDEAERRCRESAEQQLQAQIASVENRFQQAVAVLQAQVRERKAWADAQCAMCEEQVRMAIRRADAAEFSIFIRQPPEVSESAASPPVCTTSTSTVTREMGDLEREMEELLSAADTRIAAATTERQAPTAPSHNSHHRVSLQKEEVHGLSRTTQELAAVVDKNEATPTRKLHVDFTDNAQPAQEREIVNGATSAPVTIASTPDRSFQGNTSLNLVSAVATEKVDFFPSVEQHDETKQRTAPVTQRSGLDTATPAKAKTPLCSCTSSPSEQPIKGSNIPRTPIPGASITASTLSPMKHGASQSPTFPEATLVSSLSCSFDAFVSVSPVRKSKAVLLR